MEQLDTQHKQGWFIKFIKGMFIGSGFILPGVSGGALAAIFGIYEPIIKFLSNMTYRFWDNVKFFIPIGLGALFGIAGLSWGVSYFLGNYETIILWFFVGAIVGTFPSLWKEAGKEGRLTSDYWVLGISAILAFLLLYFGQASQLANLAPSFLSWMLCGFLIALGILVPGMSPSNFIVYIGLYKEMADGFKALDFSVIIPIGIGGLLTILLLAKGIHYIFDHYYAKFFHFIVGVVLASTIMIIPTNYSGLGTSGLAACVGTFVLGCLVGLWMAQLEEKYK